MEEIAKTAAENWWAAPALVAFMAACKYGRKWLIKLKK